jgi:hypothetical protein
MRGIEAKIERAARRRQATWAAGCDPVEIAARTRELDELYSQLRVERARRDYGDRLVIVKRARVERELERLMESNA